MKIQRAESSSDIKKVRELFLEYRDFLGLHLDFQSFEQEIASLPGEYSPPDGELLIAVQGGRVVGCVAMRRLDESGCEMKRLFVRKNSRGKGTGRALAESIIIKAKEAGYSRMRLDTLDRLAEAMSLYESLGFRRIAPYYINPLEGVVYWEMDLDQYQD